MNRCCHPRSSRGPSGRPSSDRAFAALGVVVAIIFGTTVGVLEGLPAGLLTAIGLISLYTMLSFIP